MEEANSKKHGKMGFLKPLLKLVKIILLIFLGSVIGYLYGEYGTPRQYQNSLTGTNAIPTIPSSDIPYNGLIGWSKPISYKKGYPIIRRLPEGPLALSIYSLEEKKLRPVATQTRGYGGTAGIGETSSLVSPNLYYTAFIAKDSGKLTILSNDTLYTKTVPTSSTVTYISGWSPNSKKIIYYIRSDSITQRVQGYNKGLQEIKTRFDPSLDSGFFVLDIYSGKTKKLYPIERFLSFIDNERILVGINDKYYQDRLVVFNLETFEADYGFVKEKFGFGAGQYNFSSDGSKWTYLLSRNPTNDANIIYADFPNKEGETIDSGAWAGVQWPIFSPTADKIAYERTDGFIKEGVPRTFTWVYDVKTKNKTKFIEGQPIQWVDDNTLIVKLKNLDIPDNFYYDHFYYLLYMNTGESKKIN